MDAVEKAKRLFIKGDPKKGTRTVVPEENKRKIALLAYEWVGSWPIARGENGRSYYAFAHHIDLDPSTLKLYVYRVMRELGIPRPKKTLPKKRMTGVCKKCSGPAPEGFKYCSRECSPNGARYNGC